MKRICFLMAVLCLFALPAQAADSGVYAGLKIMDSIQETGSVNHSDSLDGIGIGSYAQHSFGGGIFVGYDFYQNYQVPVRTELEFDLRTAMEETWSNKGNIEGQDYTVNTDMTMNLPTLFANVYWDFHNSTAFTPYIGGGIGLAFVSAEYTVKSPQLPNIEISKSVNQANFAWNLGAGVSYAFNDAVSVDVSYRYVNFGPMETSKTIGSEKFYIDAQPQAHEFALGVRYNF